MTRAKLLPPELADIIRAEMARQNKTVEQIEELSGVSAPTVSKIRKGKNVNVYSLESVCKALGLVLRIEKPMA